MASSKDIPPSRPMSGSLPRHSVSSRQHQHQHQHQHSHSHSLSLGATNPSHRINRRKSMTSSTAVNAAAAIAATLREQGHTSAGSTHAHRRSMGSRKALESTSMGASSGVAAHFPRTAYATGNGNALDHNLAHESIEDNAIDDAVPAEKGTGSKNRNRRASEGSYLVKGEGKRVSSELRCDTCGKSYKHSSCLTKHLWEHDPAWAVTSKLLISKHQQVQLLEAASVLVTMNVDSPSPPPEPLHTQESDGSSPSPGFSGSSEPQDDLSSAETSPPPMSEGVYPVPDQKRQSTSSAAFSRSYRSIPSSSYAESLISPGLPPQRYSVDYRPGTSGTDDGGLAAAAELLNFGTPRTRPVLSSPDVPPVPPLPERYQATNRFVANSCETAIYNPLTMHPPALTQLLSEEREVKGGRYIDGLSGVRRRANVDDDDDDDDDDHGLFKMEE